MKYYYYLYYRIYKLMDRIGNVNTHFSACLNLSTFGLFLFMSVFILAFGKTFPKELGFIIFIAATILIMLINIFIIFYKKRYLKIVEMFKNETKRQKNISTAAALFLFVFNLVFFIYAVSST